MFCILTFSTMLLIMASMMMVMSNPVAIMLTILIQSMNLTMILWLINKTAWFSFLLFMIFLGGLMVLFIYITSLASNEKFSFDWINSIKLIFPPLITSVIMVLINPSLISKATKMINTFNLITLNFSHSLLTPISMVMIYLLITLIVVVKISSKIQGPLRNMIKK
uniref:NADH dehydrogenase subunit 6 n=1 Tax=Cyphoderus albinus TaxID=1499079 RepID=A0A6H0EXA9_9HEXA|nr:NADH dehydrogenase subunit 6 [Cyphoderus albinus]QIT06455.1 NADH dehydrogenase subunit 6 [Cyphoderus albinus]